MEHQTNTNNSLHFAVLQTGTEPDLHGISLYVTNRHKISIAFRNKI